MLLASTLLFISIVSYGFLNAWMWDRARRAFPLLDRRLPSFLGFASILILTASPIATRILDVRGFYASASALAILTDTWPAIVFWFCILALALNLWDHSLRIVAWRRPGAKRLALGTRAQFIVAVSITASLAVWGMIEATYVRPRIIRITTAKLPAASRPITIAQISDLHIGLDSRRRSVKQAALLIRERRPDLIVATGDVLDGGDPASRDLSSLAALEAPLGKFAVLGNHEYYTGPRECVAAMRNAGFTMLMDETASVDTATGAHLTLWGADDPARFHTTLLTKSGSEVSRTTPDLDASSFILLLRHRPDVGSRMTEPFDLQLSGHTHGGQIAPFRYLVRLAHHYTAGLYDLRDGRLLYVNLGVGTWGPPLRFLAPPEVAFIVLEPARE